MRLGEANGGRTATISSAASAAGDEDDGKILLLPDSSARVTLPEGVRCHGGASEMLAGARRFPERRQSEVTGEARVCWREERRGEKVRVRV